METVYHPHFAIILLEGSWLFSLTVVQRLQPFFSSTPLLAALHLFTSAAALYVIAAKSGVRPGQLSRGNVFATLPAAAVKALQVLATFEALKRSSVLFIASWVCLARVALLRPVWGTQRPNGALTKTPLLRLQGIMLFCALCALALDMLLGSRPHIRSVAWLFMWMVLEAGSLAGFPRLATTMRGAKSGPDADELPEGTDTMPHLFLRQLGASFILLLIAQAGDGMAALTTNLLTIPDLGWLVLSATAWSLLSTLCALQCPGLSLTQLRGLLSVSPRTMAPTKDRVLTIVASVVPFAAIVLWEISRQRVPRKLTAVTTILIACLCCLVRMNLAL